MNDIIKGYLAQEHLDKLVMESAKIKLKVNNSYTNGVFDISNNNSLDVEEIEYLVMKRKIIRYLISFYSNNIEVYKEAFECGYYEDDEIVSYMCKNK